MVGVAVVGTGFGCLTHVRGLRAAGFDVLSLVGRDPSKTAARAARFEVPNACTSLADALSLSGVDAVTIATPPHTHAELALGAIAAGKHVLCEKPFTRDAAEGERVLTAAEAAGVVHFLGAEFRWASGQAAMSACIRAGTIGEPRLALFLLHIPLLAAADARVPDWWSDASAGGGWLGAHAPHVVDQVRSALGEIEAVSAVLPHIVDRAWTVEDGYSVQARLASGAVAVLQSVASDRGPFLISSRVVGSAGTVWAEGDHVQVRTASGTATVDPPSGLEPTTPDPPPADLLVTEYDLLHATGIDMGPWTRMAAAFRDRILGRPAPEHPAVPTFADGVASMRVLDAIRRSAATGEWVGCGT